MSFKRILLLSVFIFFAGCSATAKNTSTQSTENVKEMQSALQSVVGAVSGKTVSEKDLKNLSKEIRKDPETQKAIQAMADTMGSAAPHIKYCPVDGQRFSAKFTVCPKHNVPLKDLE